MERNFTKEYHTDEISFRYAKGKSVYAGKELHPFHEIVFVVGGEAEFISEKRKEKVLQHTAILIPKSTFHQFVYPDENEYLRCVFVFDKVSGLDTLIEKKMKEILILQNDKLTDLFLSYKNLAMFTEEKEEKDAILKGFFALVLANIKKSGSHTQAVEALHPITANAIRYISEHLSSPCSISEIAKALHVSSSYLSHVFKNDMRVSLYKYVLEKKLFSAHEKILNDTCASVAAIECGFGDYSGFYRQYKKVFGAPPSKFSHSKAEQQ